MVAEISKEAALNEIRRVDKLVDGPLTVIEFSNLSTISKRAPVRHFECWNNAKDAAGVETLERGKTKTSYRKKSRYEKTRLIKAVQEYSPCYRCGENYAAPVMDYHHVGDDKEKEVVQMKGAKWERIKNEMRKTVMLCANCHRIVEHVE